MRIYIYTYIYVYTYIYIYRCMYVYVCIYIYIHMEAKRAIALFLEQDSAGGDDMIVCYTILYYNIIYYTMV